jgi:hypothetical protein
MPDVLHDASLTPGLIRYDFYCVGTAPMSGPRFPSVADSLTWLKNNA